MTDRSRVRASSLTTARWYRRRTSEFSAAVGVFFFCAGLVLLPALAALDLTVEFACRNLDRPACAALFQPPSE